MKKLNEISKGKSAWLKNAQKRRCERLADKMIKEMQEAGLTPEQMLKVLRLTKEKYEYMIKSEKAT